jgi:hypothetical protein
MENVSRLPESTGASVLAAGLTVAELAMDLAPTDRPRLYGVAAIVAFLTDIAAMRADTPLALPGDQYPDSGRRCGRADRNRGGGFSHDPAYRATDPNLVMVELSLSVGLGGAFSVRGAPPQAAAGRII